MEPVERCAAKQSAAEPIAIEWAPESGKNEVSHCKIRVTRRPEHSNTECPRRAIRTMTKISFPEAHPGHIVLPLH